MPPCSPRGGGVPASSAAQTPFAPRRQPAFLFLLLLHVLLVLPVARSATSPHSSSMASAQQHQNDEKALRLEWLDLCCRTKASSTGPGRELLRHVSGQAKPGRYVRPLLSLPPTHPPTHPLNHLPTQLPNPSSE